MLRIILGCSWWPEKTLLLVSSAGYTIQKITKARHLVPSYEYTVQTRRILHLVRACLQLDKLFRLAPA